MSYLLSRIRFSHFNSNVNILSKRTTSNLTPVLPNQFIPELKFYYKRKCRRCDEARRMIGKHLHRIMLVECDIETPEHAFLYGYSNGNFATTVPHAFLHGHHLFQRGNWNEQSLNDCLTDIEKSNKKEHNIERIVTKYWKIPTRYWGHPSKNNEKVRWQLGKDRLLEHEKWDRR